MNIEQTVNIQVNVNPQIHQNCEFKSAYEHFERLLHVDDSYFSGLNVGEMRTYRFKNGDAIVYSLVSEASSNGIKNYVIEIEHFIPKNAWEALKQNQGLFKKCWRILQRGVARADSFEFYIQIAIAIGVLSILFASKIVSSDVPEIKNRPPVPEHQAPKLPENK
ncbi:MULTISPECIES: hypothetical protein [unclassified Tolypothrix]|uniref:hypothetical protein n=1 Tax=unclassified Tolypothrix TaxID=2649714 RepID=UPI0005EAB3FA|nr:MULTISPECIES: hypothetical protein [unclassified Tolypothrix]BAY96052.1 hypothetical protein NIES3275_81290 [Microchaete diplosiphon NIES-3275]EKE98238.1 hypothetical protein FDUTEX481_04256 [Tolypothrix sp. PCC 7601]MBE9085514.1 hypothetical protein [Tolypothrix sp. LEGE 11397]UYD31112.1 hypothetical protein HGR01_40255 [Tolypothrix sp. PCC 7712]UYD38916.1 hypothetical protein HG267_41100 [Tolypothrix sp. PCC 7601]